MYHLSIAAALLHQKPERIYLHYRTMPHGSWWDDTVKLCGPVLRLRRVPSLNQIFGRPIFHFAHKSDVLRLEILIQYGGIYLDLDMVLVRSLDPLRMMPTVLAEEGTGDNNNTHELRDFHFDFDLMCGDRSDTFSFRLVFVLFCCSHRPRHVKQVDGDSW